MLQSLGQEIWIADGGNVSFFGFAYPTRMAVVRLEDGGLWLWSPIELRPELESQVRDLGPVKHLVSPNKLQYLFLNAWQNAFPDARMWGTALTIAKRRKLHFGGTLTDSPPAEWAGQIDQFYLTNSRITDELIFYYRASRAAIIADLSQTFSDSFLVRHWPWWLRTIARMSRMTEGQGYPPFDYWISFRRRATARPKICALIAAHSERVVVAHGEIVRAEGEDFLRRAFAWLI
jgi:hypothetical protein